MRDVKRDLIFFSVESLAKSVVGQFFLRFLYHSELYARTHTHTHIHSHTQIQETNIHALIGILNLDPSNRGGCRLHLILHGHCVSAFRCVRKNAKFTLSFVMSLCPSAWSYSSSYWTDLHETRYLINSRKSVKKIQVPLKSDKNDDYSVSVRMFINDHASFNSFLKEKYLKQICRGSQNTFMFNKCFPKIMPFVR